MCGVIRRIGAVAIRAVEVVRRIEVLLAFLAVAVVSAWSVATIRPSLEAAREANATNRELIRVADRRDERRAERITQLLAEARHQNEQIVALREEVARLREVVVFLGGGR